MLIPFILGGGGTWLLVFRRKRKQLAANIAAEQYQDYAKSLDDFVTRLHKLGTRLADVMDANQQLREQVSVIPSLEARIEELEAQLRQFKTED